MCKVTEGTVLCSWLSYHNIKKEKKDSYVDLTLIPEKKFGKSSRD